MTFIERQITSFIAFQQETVETTFLLNQIIHFLIFLDNFNSVPRNVFDWANPGLTVIHFQFFGMKIRKWFKLGSSEWIISSLTTRPPLWPTIILSRTYLNYRYPNNSYQFTPFEKLCEVVCLKNLCEHFLIKLEKIHFSVL